MESRDWSSDGCSSDLFPSHDNEVGNKVIDIAHPNGRAVSKFPILKGVRIVFYER